MTGSQRHGWAVWAAMAILFLAGVTTRILGGSARQSALGGNRSARNRAASRRQHGRQRSSLRHRQFSALFATVTTDASCGAINGWHDSFTPLGGMVPLVNIMLSEVIFGGVGAGMYGMLIYIVLAVFIAGLDGGRTPEYLGKKIEAYDVKMAMLVVWCSRLSFWRFAGDFRRSHGFGTSSITNPGPHGFQRDSLRLHFRRRQQRLGVWRVDGKHSLVQHRPSASRCWLGAFLDDHSHAGDRRQPGAKKYVPPSLGTFPGNHAAVHRAADRRDHDRRRADILPGTESGTDS